jgi:hypothetical protein
MIVEQLRWQKTGKKSLSSIRATVSPGMMALVCPEDQYRMRGQRFPNRLSLPSKTMNPFCVWLQPLRNGCDIRVLGIDNAKWLLNRLTQLFAIKNSEAVNEVECYPRCSFRMLYSFQMPRRRFKQLLAAIPEVKLMLDLAWGRSKNQRRLG